VALGYEVTRSQQTSFDSQLVVWEERILVVYSPSLAKQARRGLAWRLERAGAVRAILRKHRVDGLLEVSYIQEVERRHICKYGDRPA
jgi:hypothetical protein